jgi:hypothetical protein
MNLHHHESLKFRTRNFCTLKKHEETEQITVAAAFYICVMEVMGSDLGRNTYCPHRDIGLSDFVHRPEFS